MQVLTYFLIPMLSKHLPVTGSLTHDHEYDTKIPTVAGCTGTYPEFAMEIRTATWNRSKYPPNILRLSETAQSFQGPSAVHYQIKTMPLLPLRVLIRLTFDVEMTKIINQLGWTHGLLESLSPLEHEVLVV